jgi:hypothetical protein
VLASIALCVGACSKPLTPSECDELLDHYTELLLQAYRPESTGPQRSVARASARAKARRDPAFVQCSRKVSRAAFECAMHAVNPDELEQCLL